MAGTPSASARQREVPKLSSDIEQYLFPARGSPRAMRSLLLAMELCAARDVLDSVQENRSLACMFQEEKRLARG